VAGVVGGRLVITDVASKVDTDAGPALAGTLAFSPTSTRVLYRADTPSGGRVAIHTIGGASVVTDIPWVDDGAHQTSWSPDSAEFVVAQGPAGGPPTTLWVVDAVSGAAVELPSASVSPETRGLGDSVRWAPDSQTLVTLGPGTEDAKADALSVFDADGALLSEATASHEIPVLGPWPSSSMVSVVGPPARQCTIKGTSKNDTLIGTPGRDVICGLGGDDIIRPGGGRDVLVGGDGVDTVDYSRSAGVVGVYMPLWFVQRRDRQQLSGIEGVVGTPRNDLMFGDDLPNLLVGGPGPDGLSAHGGDDRIRGGSGRDDLLGDTGADVVRGDRGDDRLWVSPEDDYSGGPGKDLCRIDGASWSPCS